MFQRRIPVAFQLSGLSKGLADSVPSAATGSVPGRPGPGRRSPVGDPRRQRVFRTPRSVPAGAGDRPKCRERRPELDIAEEHSRAHGAATEWCAAGQFVRVPVRSVRGVGLEDLEVRHGADLWRDACQVRAVEHQVLDRGQLGGRRGRRQSPAGSRSSTPHTGIGHGRGWSTTARWPRRTGWETPGVRCHRRSISTASPGVPTDAAAASTIRQW